MKQSSALMQRPACIGYLDQNTGVTIFINGFAFKCIRKTYIYRPYHTAHAATENQRSVCL